MADKNNKGIFILLLSSFFMVQSILFAQTAWRSSLYPEDWQPGYQDAEGRFLHDFSYAGYHRGEIAIPDVQQNVIDVTQPPYLADNTGVADATSAIQSAINDVSKSGGGVVFMPEGTYAIQPQNNSTSALTISTSHVVLRGAGHDKTFLYNGLTYMRNKNMIRVSAASKVNWKDAAETDGVRLTEDILMPTTIIPVTSVANYQVGDLIIIRSNCTDAFVADYQMTGKWGTNLSGIILLRRVVDKNSSTNTLTIDAPTRHWMKVRDRARVFKAGTHLEEVGLEDFSIGMRHNEKEGYKDEDYVNEGTGAYEVHACNAIAINYTINSWVTNIHTYKPEVNGDADYHIVSNGLSLYMSRYITVKDCNIQKPQYEGGGGNGYLYILSGEECLLSHCHAEHGRHNYDFKKMWASGNVIHHCTSSWGRLATDFHMHLSPANLFDNFRVYKDFIEARYRPYTSNLHGHTTTESVFWNTHGDLYKAGVNYIVYSQQYGWGYIIGSKGPAYQVAALGGENTEPIDLIEGMGEGETLEPQSLYADQLERRTGIPTVINGAAKESRVINDFYLGQNYPNPFNGSTTFQYRLEKADHVTLKLYNINGRLKKTLVHSEQSAGVYEVQFHADNLSSGIYFYVLEQGQGKVYRKKMIYLK